MKTTQHTPGKWIVAPSSHEDAEFIIGIAEPDPRGEGYNPQIALVRNSKCAKDNARLIAAAPELLEACKALLACDMLFDRATVGVATKYQEAYAQAKAAIQSAQGKE